MNMNCPRRKLVNRRIDDLSVLIHNVVAIVVGVAVRDARLDSAASHPTRKAPRMVVATVVFLRKRSLAVNRSTEFSAPNDECVVEHSQPLEVLNERGCGLIDIFTLRRQVVGHVSVLVPATVENLDEPHASLGEPPGQKAVCRVSPGRFRFLTVEFKNLLGLLLNIHQFWDARLHPVRHFVLRDTGGNFWVAKLVKL